MAVSDVSQLEQRLKVIDNQISVLTDEKMDVESKIRQSKLAECKAAGHNDWSVERMHGSCDCYTCKICGVVDFR